MFLFLGVSGFMVEAVRIANIGRPAWERWSFVGYALSSLLKGHRIALYQWLWVGHVGAYFADREVYVRRVSSFFAGALGG